VCLVHDKCVLSVGGRHSVTGIIPMAVIIRILILDNANADLTPSESYFA
jgi:hypothetical protein